MFYVYVYAVIVYITNEFLCIYLQKFKRKRFLEDFQAIWWHRQTWLASLYNHIHKIATKKYNITQNHQKSG